MLVLTVLNAKKDFHHILTHPLIGKQRIAVDARPEKNFQMSKGLNERPTSCTVVQTVCDSQVHSDMYRGFE